MSETNGNGLTLASPHYPALIEHGGKQAVSARDLYESLGLESTNFGRWVKQWVETAPWKSGKDYEVFVMHDENPQGGRPARDYALSARRFA